MEIKDLIYKTEKVDWRKLNFTQPDNLKKTNKDRMNKLKKSLVNNGFAMSFFVFEKEGKIFVIDGHHRLKALQELSNKGSEIPDKFTCSFLKVESDKHIKKLVLAFNSHYAEIDKDGLFDFIDDLDIDDVKDEFEFFELGFDLKEDKERDESEDEVPDIEEIAKSKTGEIWLLGSHRILCGDNINLHSLMNSKKADIVFTDPPYGVAIGSKNKMLNSFQPSEMNLKEIKDDTASPEELKDILVPAFINLRENCKDDCTYFVTAPQGGELGMMMMMMMKEAGLLVRHVLIWKKNQPTFSMNRLDYDYEHEPILLTWTRKHNYYGEGKHKTSVWQIAKPTKSKEHPTMKPVELVENALLNNSRKDDLLLDIYLGSGTSIIAAEQTDRICYGSEIEPCYIDVIIKRWQEFTGKEAIRESDGVKFNDL
jgi:site-specific DNA-methyltransferase (adenine-specific)